MDIDDLPVGKILTRREAIALLGAAGAAMIVACAPGQTPTALPTGAPAATNVPLSVPTVAPTGASAQAAPTATPAAALPSATTVASLPTCIVRPALTEGPYFVDEKLNRADIRTDPSDGAVSAGAPLKLVFQVSQLSNNACTPLSGAQVDVWQCNAQGVYSDVQDSNFGSTKGKKFLRGYQITDANGRAEFMTIYPGWYRGRTVHIHFKIRTNAGSNTAHEFTSQLFFDDAFTDAVYKQEPYAARGQRTPRNDGDGIYRQSGGQLTLDVQPQGDGYAATFNVGMQLS